MTADEVRIALDLFTFLQPSISRQTDGLDEQLANFAKCAAAVRQARSTPTKDTTGDGTDKPRTVRRARSAAWVTR